MTIRDFNAYAEAAMRTAKQMPTLDQDLIHAALGLASESGELIDAIKKHVIYGKPLDVDNCIEELGDCLWFIALACQTLGVSIGQVARANIAKLAKRYPDKYTDQAAIARADKQEGA
jgi:NTP pyrophosphatase (non-canonical NTP hydrolase)